MELNQYLEVVKAEWERQIDEIRNLPHEIDFPLYVDSFITQRINIGRHLGIIADEDEQKIIDFINNNLVTKVTDFEL